MTSTYTTIFHHVLNEIFFCKTQRNLCKCSNKSNRFHLKMESDEEAVAAIVTFICSKK